MAKNDHIWVIIPAYNEAKRISPVLKKTKKYCLNILVVDDGSSDKTYNVAEQHKVKVIKHIVNLGKGAALKSGCDYAVKHGAKILIALDADGQHNPNRIPDFLEALDGKDIVFGYRLFTKKMPFLFRFGNTFINLVIRILYRINLCDTQCGYRAFTSSAYKKIRWNSNDYTMESEMIANAGKHNLKHTELKIRTIYPERYKGTTALDGIKIVLKMILWRFKF
jgi:glycosyltransferase involved in cell wall biosynthesis